MSLEKCDRDVYDNGETVGLFDMTREQAEHYCLMQTKVTDEKHDWYWFGGRVCVKKLKRA